MISKHKDLAIVFVRAISMLIIVIYHYSCSLVQDHITNKHLPLYGYASGRWGQLEADKRNRTDDRCRDCSF